MTTSNATVTSTCINTADHHLTLSNGTSVISPLLVSTTTVMITRNPNLAVVVLPFFTIATFNFLVYDNSVLTLLSVPLLTYIRYNIQVCMNAPAFVLPSPPLDAPTIGLVSADNKGTGSCHLASGNTTCSPKACE